MRNHIITAVNLDDFAGALVSASFRMLLVIANEAETILHSIEHFLNVQFFTELLTQTIHHELGVDCGLGVWLLSSEWPLVTLVL